MHVEVLSMETCNCSGSDIWAALPLERIAPFVPRNFVACSLRLVNKHSASKLKHPEFTIVHLSEPCPVAYFQLTWGIPEAVKRIHNLDAMRRLYIPESANALGARQRRQLVSLTAASGVLANLEVAFEVAGCTVHEEMMEAAAAAGKLDSCKWLRARGCPWGRALVAAGLSGHQHVYEYMLVMGCACSDDALFAPCRGGHTGLMDWLSLCTPNKSSSSVRVDKLIAAAAEGCDFQTFIQLHKAWLQGLTGMIRASHLPGKWQSAVLAAAARSLTPDWREKVNWLEGRAFPRTSTAAAAAAICSDGIDRVQWLRDRGYPMVFGRHTFHLAGLSGNITMVKYLLSEFALYQFTTDAAEAAARIGHLEFIKELHEVSKLDGAAVQSVIIQAACGGNLELVTWAVKNPGLHVYDCRTDPHLLPAAVESGNMELVEWVWERNKLRPSETAAAAARGGNRRVLEWIENHDFLQIGDPVAIYFNAAHNGDLATLRWLRERLPLPDSIVSRCVRGECPQGVIDWLVDNSGCSIVDWGMVGLLGGDLRGVSEFIGRAGSMLSSNGSTVDSSLVREQQHQELQELLQELHSLRRELQDSPQLRQELPQLLRKLPTQTQEALRQQMDLLMLQEQHVQEQQ